MSVGMSILDYTTGLFREPASLRAFVDDPRQALRDAGFPDATPEQVHDLLPVIAESMPPDHPLQAVVRADDPAAALRALDIDDLIADAHDHHRDVALIEKALGGPDVLAAPQPRCTVSDEKAGAVVDVGGVATFGKEERGHIAAEKALGAAVDAPLTLEIAGPPPDDVPEPDGAVEGAAGLLEQPDLDAVAWGKDLE